jgi:hypothetical protein
MVTCPLDGHMPKLPWPIGCIHPGKDFQFVTQHGRGHIVDFMAQNNPPALASQAIGGNRHPVSGCCILNPSQVNHIIHVVEVVNVSRAYG